MSFFAIQENVLVNTDEISSVEQKIIEGRIEIVVTTGNKEFVVERNPQEFVDLIKNIGTTEGDFAGR